MKNILFQISEDEYSEFREKLDKLKEHYRTTNQGQAILQAIRGDYRDKFICLSKGSQASSTSPQQPPSTSDRTHSVGASSDLPPASV